MNRRDAPPCPVCGRTKDRHHCWRDTAHDSYYAAQEASPRAVASANGAVEGLTKSNDMFGGAA